MPVTRTYFMLHVADMDRAVGFYRQVLGPVVRVESPTWTELKLGDATVALHAGSDVAPRQTGLSVEVADLRAAYEAVLAHGGRVLAGPFTDPTGGWSYEVADTEGNTFLLGGAVDQAPPPATEAATDPRSEVPRDR